MVTGAVAAKAEAVKNKKYLDAANLEQNVSFHPLAFESYGAWSEESRNFLTKVANFHASPIQPDLWSPTSTTFKAYWLSRISTTLRRTQAELIIHSYNSDNYEPHLAA